jgi:hypothetical protein
MEYLVGYGRSGEFARFRAEPVRSYQRGDRVLVRTSFGLDVGEVLCPVAPGHTPFLSRTQLGTLLRPLDDADQRRLDELRTRSALLVEDAQRLAAALAPAAHVLDVELLFDGAQAVLHCLAPASCDLRPFVSAFAARHDLVLRLENFAALDAPNHQDGHSERGCGKPDCGKKSPGDGCSSCGTGNNCSTCGASSTSSCGAGVSAHDVAHLLQRLQANRDRSPRVPLL